jgi:hypothetical protein
MAFEKSYDEPQPVLAPACLHLRNKAMYVTGDPRAVDDVDASSGQHCWCNRTQHVRGPDQQSVDRASCVPGRECYEETG